MITPSVRQLFRETKDYLDREIAVCGWVRTVRDSRTFGFIELNDGTFFRNLQVVFDNRLANFEDVARLNVGASLRVKGLLVSTPQAKQPFELKAGEVEVEGASTPDFPLQKKRHSFEFLREIAHLRTRTNTFSAVFRVRSLAAQAIHNFFQERGFIWVHTPIVTASDCEGAGEMFRVTTLDPLSPPLDSRGQVDYTQDFFGRQANLTVSGQLNVETFCMAFQKVYTFGPTFRAENSNTARHAAEFWMIEPEIAFADLQDNMRLAEDMVKHLIGSILEKAPEEMEFFNRMIDPGLLDRLQRVAEARFEKITYTEAIGILEKAPVSFEFPAEWGKDLQTEHERYLSEKVFQKPVFVTDYPKTIKAFYMRLNDDDRTVAAMDLLVPGVGEIIGGSQREERYDVLRQRIEEMGLNPEDYGWYLDLRKFGGCRHAGYGLGFERAIMYLTGMGNIRDVIPFPRTVKSIHF